MKNITTTLSPLFTMVIVRLSLPLSFHNSSNPYPLPDSPEHSEDDHHEYRSGIPRRSSISKDSLTRRSASSVPSVIFPSRTIDNSLYSITRNPIQQRLILRERLPPSRKSSHVRQPPSSLSIQTGFSSAISTSCEFSFAYTFSR